MNLKNIPFINYNGFFIVRSPLLLTYILNMHVLLTTIKNDIRSILLDPQRYSYTPPQRTTRKSQLHS